MKISDFLKQPNTISFLSFIWGLGLAIMIMNKCMDGHCVVVHGPVKKDVQNKVFQVGDSCFKFRPEVTECKKDAVNEK